MLASYDTEAAYKLLENEEIPGWLSMPKNGATTIWENWDGPFNTQGAGLGSLNHYSKGAVIEWLFKVMCGIRVDGENHFIVAPQPGGHFTRAEAGYTSVFGRIESCWERELDEAGKAVKTIYTVTVPANCTADIHLPGGMEKTVGAGEHQFRE